MIKLMALNAREKKDNIGNKKDVPLGEDSVCAVCNDNARGVYFGARVCLPCKSFFIRCTKDTSSKFVCQGSGRCDISKINRLRCQSCRFKACLHVGMCRKEKPESIQLSVGQELCRVCSDIANGIHFGVLTCEGCKKFFRRGLLESDSYLCKFSGNCSINPRNRNMCRYCRYQRCIDAGMSRQAIKMGRPKKTESSMNQHHELSHCEAETELSQSGSGPETATRVLSAPEPAPATSTRELSATSIDSVSEVKTEPSNHFLTQSNNLKFEPLFVEEEKVHSPDGKSPDLINNSPVNDNRSCSLQNVTTSPNIPRGNIGMLSTGNSVTNNDVTSGFQTSISTSDNALHTANYYHYKSPLPCLKSQGSYNNNENMCGNLDLKPQVSLTGQGHTEDAAMGYVLDDISQDEMDSLLESLQGHDNKRHHEHDGQTWQLNTNKIRKIEDHGFQQHVSTGPDMSSCRIGNNLSPVMNYNSPNVVTDSQRMQEPTHSPSQTGWVLKGPSYPSSPGSDVSQSNSPDPPGFNLPSNHFLGCGHAQDFPHFLGNAANVIPGDLRAAKCASPTHIKTIYNHLKTARDNNYHDANVCFNHENVSILQKWINNNSRSFVC